MDLAVEGTDQTVMIRDLIGMKTVIETTGTIMIVTGVGIGTAVSTEIGGPEGIVMTARVMTMRSLIGGGTTKTETAGLDMTGGDLSDQRVNRIQTTG